MYNSYIPQGDYVPASPQEGGEQEQRQRKNGGILSALFGGSSGPGLPKLDGILKAFHLDRFDKGDILLILVLVYLFIESDDEDWLIVLALVVLMGL